MHQEFYTQNNRDHFYLKENHRERAFYTYAGLFKNSHKFMLHMTPSLDDDSTFVTPRLTHIQIHPKTQESTTVDNDLFNMLTCDDWYDSKSMNDLLRLALSVVDAVEWLHGNHVIFFDLKIENLVVVMGKSQDTVAFIDFEGARQYDSKTGKAVPDTEYLGRPYKDGNGAVRRLRSTAAYLPPDLFDSSTCWPFEQEKWAESFSLAVVVYLIFFRTPPRLHANDAMCHHEQKQNDPYYAVWKVLEPFLYPKQDVYCNTAVSRRPAISKMRSGLQALLKE